MGRFVGSVIVLAISALTAAAEPLTDGDRQRLLAHLDMTESWLLSEVTDLSDEQVRFHRAPDAWSIMDVVEHLAIAETAILAAATGIREAARSRRASPKRRMPAFCGTASTGRTDRRLARLRADGKVEGHQRFSRRVP